MDPHNHTQQNRPSQKRPDPPAVLLLIQQQPDGDTPKNLGDPIDGIVQRPALDIKQDAVVIAVLPGVEIVAGEEHGKEEDDEWVCSDCDPEAFELGFPRWVPGSCYSGTVGSDHLVWGSH